MSKADDQKTKAELIAELDELRHKLMPKNIEGAPEDILGVVTDIADRKQAENTSETALRESEAKYRSLTENSQDIIIRFDKNFKHLYVSPNIERVFNTPATNYIGKTHREIGYPEDRCIFWEEKIKAVFDSGEPFETEFQFDGINGPIIFNWRLIPEFNEIGAVSSVLSISRDITEHRKTEKKYSEIFNTMQEGFAVHEMIWDTDGNPIDYRFIAANPAFERLTGLKAQDLVGKRVLDVLPQTEKYWIDNFGKVVSSGNPISFENYSASLNRYYQVKAFRNEPNQFAVIFEDITERKLAEDALRKSELRLRTAIKFTYDWEFWIKPDGNFVYITPSCERVTGYSSDEFINNPELIKSIAHPDDQSHICRHFGKVDSADSHFVDFRIVTRSGEVKWISHACQAVFDENGEFLGRRSTNRDITERKLAEEALRKSEVKYRQLVENLNEGIWVIDNDSNTTFVNNQMANMLGFTVEEMLGRHLYSFMSEDGKRIAAENVRRRQQGIKERHDFEFLKKDGTTIYTALETAPITDDKGNYCGAIAGVQDITERRRAETALLASEQFLQTQFLNSPDIILIIDREFKIVRINRVLAGPLIADQLVGQDAIEILPSSDREHIRALVTESFTHGKTQDFEHNIGEGVCVHARIVPLKENDVVTKVMIISTDITERKRTQDALKESETRFREVVSASPNSVAILQDGKYAYGNPACLKMSGYEESEFLGLDALVVIHPDSRDIILDRVKNLDRGSSNTPIEIKLLRKNGEVIQAESASVPIKHNNRPAALIITRDVSHRKQIEEERLKSQKLESIGVLAGGIAHDFNNILTALWGNIQIASMNTKPEDENASLLAEAEKACVRARDLTRQLLTFAKGGAPIKKTISLNSLIKDSCHFAIRGAKSKCNFSIPDDLWKVDGDEGQLNQVLNNLVINADQASPEGGVIEVAAENFILDSNNQTDKIPLKEGKYVKISVADHGVGIAGEYLTKIFDPYFTTKQKGSGLGLATTYSIVKRHDGYLGVESTLGKGSTFYAYLPATSKEVAEIKKTDKLITGSGKILVMDDESQVKDIVGNMLKVLGYKTEFASDGEEAIEMFRNAFQSNKPFDAVILDLTIPGGMGGLKCLLELLKIDPNVKGIVASGYSNDPVMANFKGYKFCGAIPKPFEIEELGRTLKNVLNR